MTSNVMVDSSILIEFIKGKKIKLYTDLIIRPNTECFINETIVSEFLFHFLAVNSNKSPRSLQSSNGIAQIFSGSFEFMLLENFNMLPNDKGLFILVPTLMKKYNLLPNDAIILATCKLNGITQLASHDADFVEPCKSEDIELLLEE